MDSGKSNNERELTSTMGNVLSVSIKDEKNDTSGSDATPTSSTDANTTTTSSQIVSDDPISSTSSDIIESNKSKASHSNKQISGEMNETVMEEPDKVSAVDTESDLLEMSISSVSREKITEDVEDLVHDLESLLGESTDSFNIPIKRKEEHKSLEEKEYVQTNQMVAEGVNLSLADPSLDRNIESIQNSDENAIKLISTSESTSLEEQVGTSEDDSRQENILSNISNTDTNQSVTENVSLDKDKELPLPLKTETDLDCKVIAESTESSTAIENDESVTENIGDVIITAGNEECLTEDKKDITGVTNENTEKVNVNETEQESTGVEEELVQERTNENEEVDDVKSQICDDLHSVHEDETSNIKTKEDTISSNTAFNEGAQKDEPERSEERVCQEESILRDAKTETVEFVDDDNEGEYSKPSELDSHNVDKLPTDSISVVTESVTKSGDIEENANKRNDLSDNKEVEDTTEVGYKVDTDNGNTSVVPSSENSDYQQLDLVEGDTEKMINQSDILKGTASSSDDIGIATTVCDVKYTSEPIIESPGSNMEEQAEYITAELPKEDSTYAQESESQMDIPQSLKPESVLDSISVEPVENTEGVEIITEEVSSVTKDTKSPVADHTEICTDLNEPITVTEVDLGVQSIQEDTSQIKIDLVAESTQETTSQNEDASKVECEKTPQVEVNPPLESNQEETSQKEDVREVECEETPQVEVDPSLKSIQEETSQNEDAKEAGCGETAQVEVDPSVELVQEETSQTEDAREVEGEETAQVVVNPTLKSVQEETSQNENVRETECQGISQVEVDPSLESIQEETSQNEDAREAECEETPQVEVYPSQELIQEETFQSKGAIEAECEETSQVEVDTSLEGIQEETSQNEDAREVEHEETSQVEVSPHVESIQENISQNAGAVEVACKEMSQNEDAGEVEREETPEVETNPLLESTQKETSQIEDAREIECEETPQVEVNSSHEETSQIEDLREVESDDIETVTTEVDNTREQDIETNESNVVEVVSTVTEQVIVEIGKSAEESLIQQTTITEIADKVQVEEIQSNIKEIDMIPDILEQHISSSDGIVMQLEEASDAVVNISELIETEPQIEADAKECEEQVQSEVFAKKVADSSELRESEQLKDVGIDEISTLQNELLLSEAAVDEHSSNIDMSDEVCEEVQTNLEQTCSVGAEPLEQGSNAEASEDVGDLVNEASECIITSKPISSEVNSEIVESTDTSSVHDVDSKQDENSQIKFDSMDILEAALAEEDKQEQGLEWEEGIIPNDNEEAASTTEVIQDDEIEDASNKVIEILDDDSKIMQVERECVPFFSSCVDSDSEDTVPTLVLEPDEAIPSPEQSNPEKGGTEELILAVDSTSETEVPDKLPGIEEILNDQGNVDDVVENIDMQENLETILAVASLQSSDNIEEVETAAVSQISDKERKEMEALRKAVESITEVSPVEYGDVTDMTVLTDSILPDSEVVDNLIEHSDSNLGKRPDTSINKITELEQHTENLGNLPTELNEEDSENNLMFEDNSKISRSSAKQEIAKEVVQTLPDTSEDKITVAQVQDVNAVLPDSSQGILVSDETRLTDFSRDRESKAKTNERPKRHRKSYADNKLEELSINVDVPEREKPYSPKVTIKPIKVPDEEVSTTSNSDLEVGKGSLKMTITKQSDKMHSVLKICELENSESTQEQDEPIPKLIIKPKIQQVEQQHSPKMSTRSSKQMYSPTSSTQRSGSPRITIKPVIKPDKTESVTPLKIKIKPDEVSKRHSPKLNIKPVTKPDEECRENIQSPRKVTIKPVVKPPEEIEQIQSPRITIKPIPKPESEKDVTVTPRLNIKPIKKQDEEDLEVDRERSSPKITIKPVVKPQESDTQFADGEDEVKERIVLKINKGNLPTPTKESKKREHPDDEKSEKLAKITVKFSKGGGHPHIVHQPEETNKRVHEEQTSSEKFKKQKTDNESPVLTRSKHKDVSIEHFTSDVSKAKPREFEPHIVETRSKHTHSISESPIETKRAKLKETPETSFCESTRSKKRESISESPKSALYNDNDDVRIIETKINSPIVISEDSRSQDSGSCIIIDDVKDPLASTPTYEISTKSISDISPTVPTKSDSASSTPTATATTPTPRKRGRPRKVPIVVREEFKEQEEPPKVVELPKKEEPPQLVHESGRPKRSCRGQSVRATLGIKPRKPRGPGRGRGGKRGMGTRVVPMKPEALSK